MEETHRKPKGNEIELESNSDVGGGTGDDDGDDDAHNMGMMSAFGHAMHDVWEHIPGHEYAESIFCLLYTSPSPRDLSTSRMPSSA